MLGRDAIRYLDSLVKRRDQKNGAAPRERLGGDGVCTRALLHLLLNSFRKRARSCYEDAPRVRIMFSLGYQVGGDASRIAVCADDHGFGGTRQEFNGTIESYEFLGSGHVSIARTDNLVHARNFFSSIGKGSDGLCPTDPVELA